MSTTELRLHLAAPPEAVYAALTDPRAVSEWMHPDDMEVHAFDARVGGPIHVSLTYADPTRAGKSSARTDSYRGRFTELVPFERVAQTLAFDTADPAMRGEMTIRFRLIPTPEGTELTARHEDVPPGIAPADNDLGWRMSFDRLRRLLEAG